MAVPAYALDPGFGVESESEPEPESGGMVDF